MSGISRPYIPLQKLDWSKQIFQQLWRVKNEMNIINSFKSKLQGNLSDLIIRTSYQFYIYKIFDFILTDPEQRRILDYIYISKNSLTFSRMEKDWELIFPKLGVIRCREEQLATPVSQILS